jgi:hypothetical protein
MSTFLQTGNMLDINEARFNTDYSITQDIVERILPEGYCAIFQTNSIDYS